MRNTLVAVLAPIIILMTLVGISRWHKHPDPPQAVPRIGSIDARIIPEGSGIIASRRYPGIYWTHSDSGNEAAVYAITREGRLVAKFAVNARNEDWEDIATDDAGHLYIAATGNNSRKRTVVQVLRLDEPDPHAGSGTLRPDRVWNLSFPEHAFNAEALFIHHGQGYLISKVADQQPASLYQFPLDDSNRSLTLRKQATLPIRSPVTAADISPDGDRIAILSVEELCIFDVADDVSRLATVAPARIPLVLPNRLEGCCFAPDGLMVTDEKSGGSYLFPSGPTGMATDRSGGALNGSPGRAPNLGH